MDLVAGGAARLERFGVVAAAVEASVAVKVDEVDEQLAADAATETRRVPHAAGAGPRRHHRHVAAAHRLAALPPKKNKQNKQTNKQKKIDTITSLCVSGFDRCPSSKNVAGSMWASAFSKRGLG